MYMRKQIAWRSYQAKAYDPATINKVYTYSIPNSAHVVVIQTGKKTTIGVTFSRAGKGRFYRIPEDTTVTLAFPDMPNSMEIRFDENPDSDYFMEIKAYSQELVTYPTDMKKRRVVACVETCYGLLDNQFFRGMKYNAEESPNWGKILVQSDSGEFVDAPKRYFKDITTL